MSKKSLDSKKFAVYNIYSKLFAVFDGKKQFFCATTTEILRTKIMNNNENAEADGIPTCRTKDRYIYLPLTQHLYTEELGDYVSYGISVTKNGEKIYEVGDVTTDLDALSALCERCTLLRLDPIHLDDVIYDFLE